MQRESHLIGLFFISLKPAGTRFRGWTSPADGRVSSWGGGHELNGTTDEYVHRGRLDQRAYGNTQFRSFYALELQGAQDRREGGHARSGKSIR